jgi:hypothetical protein
VFPAHHDTSEEPGGHFVQVCSYSSYRSSIFFSLLLSLNDTRRGKRACDRVGRAPPEPPENRQKSR